jgi:hypothetical protein
MDRSALRSEKTPKAAGAANPMHFFVGVSLVNYLLDTGW